MALTKKEKTSIINRLLAVVRDIQKEWKDVEPRKK